MSNTRAQTGLWSLVPHERPHGIMTILENWQQIHLGFAHGVMNTGPKVLSGQAPCHGVRGLGMHCISGHNVVA